jgi:hypothetical protein
MNIQSINGTSVMEHVRDIDMALSDSERGGLPAWTYFSQELLELERRELFRKCWQLAATSTTSARRATTSASTWWASGR